MPDHRQKKIAKHKKKRATVNRSFASATNRTAEQQIVKILREAQTYPIGPCFVGQTWKDQSASRVLPVAIARSPSPGHFILAIYLVDLGCVGLKDGFLTPPFTEEKLRETLQNLANAAQVSLESIPANVASTIVREAVKWGKKHDFQPAPPHELLLSFLPTETLDSLEVPLGRNGRVVYEPDAGEDTRPIVRKLVQLLGPDGFEVVLPRKPSGPQTSATNESEEEDTED